MIEQHHILNELAKWADDHKIRSTMAQQLTPINVANLKEAYGNLLTGRTIGKIVLEGPFE